ncbi:hypothetical protein [Bacillus swezeyi]|uniref:hypothetical protein n=1 Tax=Bacillus swezeyi TaxID=1925020 RepID=UPI003F887D16
MKNPDIDENETYRIGRKAQSITAPHHLPDVWKQIALLKLSQALQMGGVFYFKLTDVHHEISQFITEYEKAAKITEYGESSGTRRDKYSTFDWMLEEMLDKAKKKAVNRICHGVFR